MIDRSDGVENDGLAKEADEGGKKNGGRLLLIPKRALLKELKST